MAVTDKISTVADRELTLTCIIDARAPPSSRHGPIPSWSSSGSRPARGRSPWRRWTCAPAASLVVMRSPEGVEFPNRGVYLEVVENKRLVFTDAYATAWEPSEKPFMTVVLTFEDEDAGSKTRYTARVRHWTVEDRMAHEQMGFHAGWGQCADQLAALVTMR